MSEQKHMNDEQLETISGGSQEETQELIDFIREIDPDFRSGEICARDAMDWLNKRVPGLGTARFSSKETRGNIYTIAGVPYSHGELMEYLHKHFAK